MFSDFAAPLCTCMCFLELCCLQLSGPQCCCAQQEYYKPVFVTEIIFCNNPKTSEKQLSLTFRRGNRAMLANYRLVVSSLLHCRLSNITYNNSTFTKFTKEPKSCNIRVPVWPAFTGFLDIRWLQILKMASLTGNMAPSKQHVHCVVGHVCLNLIDICVHLEGQ